jgi:hypothetical protein
MQKKVVASGLSRGARSGGRAIDSEDERDQRHVGRPFIAIRAGCPCEAVPEYGQADGGSDKELSHLFVQGEAA